MVVAGGIAGVAVGLAAVYGIGRFQRNAGDAACRPAVELAQRIAPLARGEVAALACARRRCGCPISPSAMPRGRDASRRLARAHRAVQPVGHLVRALPQGDAGARRARGKLGGPAFEVVAVNIDTRDPDKRAQWLKEVGIDRLAYYADPSAKVFQDLKSPGAPPACRRRC
jgi:hypothetical protein